MNQDLLHQAAAIFDTSDKWRAFHDMRQACPDIVNHWLRAGSDLLRREFANHTKWKCDTWGHDRDTRWYLGELEKESINVGIGWETFELHLFDGRSHETWQEAVTLLEKQEFQYLINRIGPRCYRSTWQKERLLLADLNFDPMQTGADQAFRASLIAWHAGRSAHGATDFVDKTAAWMRQLLEDDEFVRLIRKLNQDSRLPVESHKEAGKDSGETPTTGGEH
jgi:hypothetical protein